MERKGLIFPDDYPVAYGADSHDEMRDEDALERYTLDLLGSIESETEALVQIAEALAGFRTANMGEYAARDEVDLEAIFHLEQALQALRVDLGSLVAKDAQ